MATTARPISPDPPTRGRGSCVRHVYWLDAQCDVHIIFLRIASTHCVLVVRDSLLTYPQFSRVFMFVRDVLRVTCEACANLRNCTYAVLLFALHGVAESIYIRYMELASENVSARTCCLLVML